MTSVSAGSQSSSATNAADLLRAVEFRSIGPSVTGGRIVDIEVHPSEPHVLYVASASGGLWKSVNNGTTWTPIFDHQKTVSIGDVAIASTDPDIIWVGTGEHNNQRSCHFGDGVYKSTDGGQTWANTGLNDSVHIGRIAIDWKDPNVVYVASAGPLYRGGGERGVYKTTDGGGSWDLILEGDNDTTGFIEIVQDPEDNLVLYAAAYDRIRRAWNYRGDGPGSGIYKTTDGGETWTRLANGLPEGDRIGRIGIAVFPKNTRIVYATIDNRTPQTGIEIYRSEDAGASWTKVNEGRATGSYYYGQIRVDPQDPDRVYVLGTRFMRSEDGGKTYQRIGQGTHVDHHALWIDPNNTDRLLDGNDGGFYISYDGGDNWDFINNLPIPQFYAIGADMALPYNVMGGTQDNGVWYGPSRTRRRSGISNKQWENILGGDGFYSIPDPEDPYTVFTSTQFGGISRVDVLKRVSRSIRPREGGIRRNWMTPFLLSPHNTQIVYWGAQKVFKSLDRGNSWTAISPDLTTNDEEKIGGNVPHCTITTLDESPLQSGVLWAGTDDGNVWLTRDGGNEWTQVNQNIEGAPSGWWVSRVIASYHELGTAYVCFTGFREDDFRPYIYKTTDFGETWTSIVGNLPDEPVSVIREDRMNPNLLVVGTELGCHISLNGGEDWHKLTNGLPTTPVQDLLIHPRDGDLVLGTHGRGIFIANITPLRQLTDEVLAKDVHLFRPDTALAFNFIGNMFDSFNGHRRYAAPNPPAGATLAYFLKAEIGGDVTIEILDVQGEVVRELEGSGKPGINVVRWNLRESSSGGRRRPGPMVQAGRYLVRLTAGASVETTTLDVVDWER